MKNANSEIEQEGWFRNYWRPAMAWTYMAIVLFDFIIAPSVVFTLKTKGVDIAEWRSLTLENGGLIHVAFGAILGIYAYGRTREKVLSMNKFGKKHRHDEYDDDMRDDRDGNARIEYEDR